MSVETFATTSASAAILLGPQVERKTNRVRAIENMRKGHPSKVVFWGDILDKSLLRLCLGLVPLSSRHIWNSAFELARGYLGKLFWAYTWVIWISLTITLRVWLFLSLPLGWLSKGTHRQSDLTEVREMSLRQTSFNARRPQMSFPDFGCPSGCFGESRKTNKFSGWASFDTHPGDPLQMG